MCFGTLAKVTRFTTQFATDWLYREYLAGSYQIRTSNVEPFVKLTVDRVGKQDLSDYGTTRAARDLLRMATDFGLLRGSTAREFTSYHLPEESFLYLLHAMFETHGNGYDVVHSPDWRLYLMSTTDVEREIYRLHQFRQLRFEVAGSLMELTLPYKTASRIR